MKTVRLGVGRAVLVVASLAVVVVACGSEPKKEPTVSTATPPATAPPTTDTPEAGAPAVDAGDPKAEKAAQCEALLDDANHTLDAERIAVDKLCKKDADCMPIKARACAFTCVNAAIPKIEEKDWNESFTKVKDGACKKWEANDCASLHTTPAPTCVEKAVWCDKGHCGLKEKPEDKKPAAKPPATKK